MSCIPFGDLYLEFKGRVYEWINAPEDATSKVYIYNFF